MIYKRLIRPILFLFPAETVHHMVMWLLRIAQWLPGMLPVLRLIYGVTNKSLEKEIAGIRFPNPVGLAAGLDKDAVAFEAFGALGFGFVEIGTVTPKPQVGNPKPRLFRLPADKALINRMGFNNSGVKAVADRLRNRSGKVIIGGNIGKNKNTPNENADQDYLECFRELFPNVDYFVINISSPNTPGLRELQEKEPLLRLLKSIQKANLETGKPKPLFLKIAPDMNFSQADDIVNIVRECKLSGLVISNTTVSREGLKTPANTVKNMGNGGLSGMPVLEKSTSLLRYIAGKSGKQFHIIASGGIFTAEDAREKLRAGADLVQLYTGFIYEGPALIGSINRSLINN